MKEKILEIKELSFDNVQEGHYNYTINMEGFQITTNEQEILVGISSRQSCCESFGYFMTNDNIADFIGATLNEVRITNELLEVEDFKKEDKDYSGNVMFVNFETSKGTLQFVAYNDHNGYYEHDAVVKSTHLTYHENL